MLTIPPPQFRSKRRQNRKDSAAPAPTGPILIEGRFDDESGLSLTFDQAIEIETFNGSALVINDPATGEKYNGFGTPVVSGAAVQIQVVVIGGASGNKILLNASGETGIVSASTGAPWAGVVNFDLSIK